jgi:predicted DNA-binding protein
LFETRAAALAAYALFVMIAEELRRFALESEQRLDATAPEISRGAATLLREVMPQLSGERQRQLAEDMARRFESRADAYSQPSSV